MGTLQNTNCEDCGGTGIVHPVVDGVVDYGKVVPCQCRSGEIEKGRKLTLLRSCALPDGADNMTFEKFERYPEVEDAYRVAKEMAQNPGKLKWLGLLGENGNGKTHLAVSICRSWIEYNIPARYAFVSLLLDELREGFSKSDTEHSYDSKFKYYCNVPLLLLDDYGLESKTAWVQEKLDTLVDYRLMNNLSLIVTSNLPLDDMPPRIRSRLARHPKGTILVISADDYCLRGATK